MDVDLQLESLRVGGSQEVAYATRSIEPHQISHAWLTLPTDVPCTGGAEADRIIVDDGRGAPGALPRGTHEIRARFDTSVRDLTLDLVVDVEIEHGGCLRAPAVSQSLPMVAPRRFVLVTSLDGGGNADLGGIRGMFGLRLGGGGWLGPVLVTAVAGIGEATCADQTCGKGADNMSRSGLAIPAALDLRYSVGSSTNGPFTGVLLVGARSSIMSARVPALDGDRRFLLYGLQGVLGFAWSDAPQGPFLHRERTPLAEFAIPVGVYWSPDTPTNHFAFALGLDVRFLVPL